MNQIIFPLIAIILGSGANILLKIGTTKNALTSFDFANLVKFITNPYLIIGILMMVVSFPFFTLTIQKFNINLAIPILYGGTFIAVAIFSLIFLKESLTWANILGMLLVISGITLIAYK